MASKRTPAANVALGGVMAALAMVVMSMGTLIPVATYVCPMLCAVLLQMVLKTCGQRIAWAWYGAVAILSLLLAPDKEAAAVFAFLGYYPIVKPKLDRLKGTRLWKTLLFNVSTLVMYWLLMHIFGLDQIASDFEEMGAVMTVIMLILGNVTFFLLDRLLGMGPKRKYTPGRTQSPPQCTFLEAIMESVWYLYILRCRDDTLYTGITTDVEKRLEAHRCGKGAKYTRGRTPLELVYRETCGTHSDALKRELAVKRMTRAEKQALIRTFSQSAGAANDA